MHRLSVLSFVLLVAGCASQKITTSESQRISSAEILRAFTEMKSTPYEADPFLKYAYTTGYVSAFSWGPASVGALHITPVEFQEPTAETAYRLGWNAGGLRAAGGLELPQLQAPPADVDARIAAVLGRPSKVPEVVRLRKENGNILVSVIGEVRSPRAYYLKKNALVVDALEMAGGLNRMTTWATSRVVRNDENGNPWIYKFPEDRSIACKVRLQDGDSIFIMGWVL